MSLEHMILGLLKDQALSGYDLNKQFKQSIQYFWSADQSQIYRTLHKLEKDKRVEVEVIVQENSPNKKLYRLTDEGRLELLRWLRTPLPDSSSRSPWLGQLYFSGELDAKEVIDLLEARVRELKEHLQTLEATMNNLGKFETLVQERLAAPDENPMTVITLHYGIERYRFEIKWAEEMMGLLKD